MQQALVGSIWAMRLADVCGAGVSDDPARRNARPEKRVVHTATTPLSDQGR
jgi:hypothetical protein